MRALYYFDCIAFLCSCVPAHPPPPPPPTNAAFFISHTSEEIKLLWSHPNEIYMARIRECASSRKFDCFIWNSDIRIHLLILNSLSPRNICATNLIQNHILAFVWRWCSLIGAILGWCACKYSIRRLEWEHIFFGHIWLGYITYKPAFDLIESHV